MILYENLKGTKQMVTFFVIGTQKQKIVSKKLGNL
jgi:hypothetical protein